MQKLLLATLTVSALSTSAYANVELYGVLDVAVGTVAHQYGVDPGYSQSINAVSQTAAPNTLTGIFNGGLQNSRWGIKGDEDLGDGQKAFFQLESGFSIQNGALSNHAQALIDAAGTSSSGKPSNTANNASAGSTNGQLFSRVAIVGLSDPEFGSIQFGRNYTPIYDILSGGYDPVQFAVLFSPLGFSSKYGGGSGISEDVRQDNSVKYSHKLGDFNVTALYKFGNQAGSTSNQSAHSFRVGYEKGPWGIQAAYQAYTDAVAATVPFANNPSTLNLTQSNTNGYLIAFKYKVNDLLNLKAGYQRYNLSAPSDPLALGTAVNYYGYSAQVYSVSASNQSSNIFYFGGDYQISPKLNLAVGYYAINDDAYLAGSYYKNGNTPTAGAQTGADSILVLSALLDYKLSPRTDIYIGGLSSNPGGAYATYANNSVIATGIRHKF